MSGNTPMKRDHSDEEKDESESPSKIMNMNDDGNKSPLNLDIHKSNGSESDVSSLPAEAKEQESVYDKFTLFKHLDIHGPMNVGTFGVHSVKFIDYGEDPKKTQPYREFIFVDGEKNTAWFWIYGENAIIWKDIKPNQVVHIENFSFETSTAARYHGASLDKLGKLRDDSVLLLDADLSLRYAIELEREAAVIVPHVNLISEIQQDHIESAVLVFHHKEKKHEITNKMNQKVDVVTSVFSTADNNLVEIIAYAEKINKVDSLENNKVYVVSHLVKVKPYRRSGYDHRYTITNDTTFTLSDVKQTKLNIQAQKITLKEIVDKEVNATTAYESELFVRAKSAQVRFKDYYQTTGFEYEESSDTHLAAIIQFHDGSIELLRGQKIRFKYHVKINTQYNKKELAVIPGSLEVLPEALSFPVNKIDTLHCIII